MWLPVIKFKLFVLSLNVIVLSFSVYAIYTLWINMILRVYLCYHLFKNKKNFKLKKLISQFIVFSISILMFSCGVNPKIHMAKVMDKVYIGMPLVEFREKIENEEVVMMNSEVTNFKVEIKTFNDALAVTGSGWRHK